MDSPIVVYMRKVLDEHTLPLADNKAGLIEAVWLVEMIHKVEKHYKEDGPK